MRSVLAITALATITGTTLGGAPTLVLDDFDSIPNDDAGGARELTLIELSNPFGQVGNFEVDTGLEAAVFNAGIGVEQEARIDWNAEGAGLNLDAGALGIVGFELDFLLVDQDFSFELTLETFDGGSATADGAIAAGGSRTESIGLGDFVIGTGFDLSDVDGVRLTLNTRADNTASLDFILSEFRAVVPAPGTAALLGLGGVFAARRRR